MVDFFTDEQIDLEKQELFRNSSSGGNGNCEKHKIDRDRGGVSPASIKRLNSSSGETRHISSKNSSRRGSGNNNSDKGDPNNSSSRRGSNRSSIESYSRRTSLTQRNGAILAASGK